MRAPRLPRGKWFPVGLILVGLALWSFAPEAGARPHRLRLPDAPGMHLPKEEPPPPAYPLSYADEVARRLGISHGKMDIFEIAPSRNNDFVPALKGGIDRNGAGLKLQWRFGE